MRFGRNSETKRINDYWNALVRNAPPDEVRLLGEVLDPARRTAIDRARELHQRVRPDAAFLDRLENDIMNAFATSAAGSIPLPRTYPGPTNGNGAPRHTAGWLPALPTRRNRRSMAIAGAALAAILLAAIIGGYFVNEQRTEHPAIVAGTPEASPASGWSQYRNNSAHTGVAAADGPHTTPIELWHLQTQGVIYSEPALVDGTLYIGSGDGNLYAVDAATGAQQWNYQSEAPVDSSPAVDDDSVFFIDRSDRLIAVDRATGERRWDVTPINPQAAVAIDGGTLYVASRDGHLYALTADSGDMLWSFDLGAESSRSPAYADGVIFAGTTMGTLFAVDAETHEELWRFDGPSGLAGSTVIDNGIVFQTHFNAVENRLFALDASTGEERWSFATESGANLWVPSVTNGVVFTPSDDGNLYALDAETGEELWHFAMDGTSESSVTLDSELVYLVDREGTLYGIDQASGEERWRVAIEGGATKGPTLVEGTLYVGTNLGVVHAFAAPAEPAIPAPGDDQSASGSPEASPVAGSPVELVWEIASGDDTFKSLGSISLGPDGTIWAADPIAGALRIFDRNGTLIDSWGSRGTGEGEFNFMHADGPWGYVAFDSEGNVYVADTGNSRIQKFAPDGTFLLSWGGSGTGDGQFTFVEDIEIDTDDNVYVFSGMQGRIQVFDSEGNFLRSWPAGDSGVIALVDDGLLHVPDGGACSVRQFDNTGVPTGKRWTPNVPPGAFCNFVATIGFDDAGHVFLGLGNCITSRCIPGSPAAEMSVVQILDMDGNFLGQWAPRTAENAPPEFYADIAVDDEGNIIVGDIDADRIQKFALLID